MKVLLDTCAAVHLALGSLPRPAVCALQQADRRVITLITPWEIALKQSRGKLSLPLPVKDWFEALCERYDLAILEFNLGHMIASAELPPLHRDPFDRILIAIARENGMPVVTSDRNLALYPEIRTIWGGG